MAALIQPFVIVVVARQEILSIHLYICDCEAVSSQSRPQQGRWRKEDEYLIAALSRRY